MEKSLLTLIKTYRTAALLPQRQVESSLRPDFKTTITILTLQKRLLSAQKTQFNRKSHVMVWLCVGFLWVLKGGFCASLQFAGQEEKRQKNERLHQHQKHENQMRDLQLQCDSNIRELQQLQVEARHHSTNSVHLPAARTLMPVTFSALKPPVVLQNEKCHLLIEHETQKLKELDEEHSLEMKEWREKLRPRKKVF